MTRLLSGGKTGSGARQVLAFGLSLLCAASLLVVAARPALGETPPDAPTGVSASAGNASATVTWSPPAPNGGPAIGSYTVSVTGGVPGQVIVLPPFSTPVSTLVTGLANGTPYTFTVTATNGAGESAPSAPSNVVTPAMVPGPPTDVSAQAGNRSAIVTWKAPADDGGSPITSYIVTTQTQGAGSVPGPVPALPGSSPAASVGALTNGAHYTFTVVAKNVVGPGLASTASNNVIPLTLPTQPTSVAALPGDGSVTVSWSPPADPGGSFITSYTVTACLTSYTVKACLLPGGFVSQVPVASPAMAVTIMGLTNGVDYKFVVSATNATGPGPDSAAVGPVSPVPDIPLIAAKTRSGYWLLGSDGAVYPFGGAADLGDAKAYVVGRQAVDLEPSPDLGGYWIVDDAGHVFAFGTAKVLGNPDTSRMGPGEKVTSLSATPSGNGYWVFTNKGRVLTVGDARYLGDMAGTALNGPVLDSIPTPTGNGYYMVGSDGGIFAFGDAKFAGSMGGRRLNAPVQSLVPDPDGVGYWLVASDGGIFAFDADFRGSMGGTPLNKPITGMVPFGNAYLMVGEDGGIFNFATDRDFLGGFGANPPARPIVSVAALRG